MESLEEIRGFFLSSYAFVIPTKEESVVAPAHRGAFSLEKI
jgi:hypothetical protein